jgi:hypothetical protein
MSQVIIGPLANHHYHLVLAITIVRADAHKRQIPYFCTPRSPA